MKVELKPIFPTAVGLVKFDKGLTAKQKNFIVDLKRTPNQGNETSVDRYLAKHKVLSTLHNFCTESINNYFQEVYRPKYQVNLKITQMWANYSQKGQWHHQHEHPNSFLSAVFYMQSDKNLDKIYFSKPKYRQLSVHTEDFQAYNSDEWWFPTEENLLIIFPSDLTHRVAPVEAEKTRISISMNTFPIGILGNDASCTECILK